MGMFVFYNSRLDAKLATFSTTVGSPPNSKQHRTNKVNKKEKNLTDAAIPKTVFTNCMELEAHVHNRPAPENYHKHGKVSRNFNG